MKFSHPCIAIFSMCALTAYAGPIVDLGTAAPFAVLAGTMVTNTDPTTINGSVGVSAGSAITGFPPGIITGGTTHAGDAVAAQAQLDLTTAYNAAAGAACGTILTGQDLGGLVLTPGVYCFATSAQLTGVLTLNGLGDPLSQFIFQIGTALTTASASSILFENGAEGSGLFWQVGSSATLGTTTSFEGNILADASITLDTGATIGCGRALARSGAVTLDANVVSIDPGVCSTAAGGVIPEPGSATLLGSGLLIGIIAVWARRALPLRRQQRL
jgi:hypothetical protein